MPGPGPSRAPFVKPRALGIGILFEHVRDSVIVADPTDGRILLWSKSAESLLGYSQSEAVGQLVEILIPERLRGPHQLGMEHFRQTGHGQYVDSTAPLELPALRKDGSEITVEMTLSSVRGRGIRRPFILAIIRDATDRKLAEEEHRRLVQEQAARAQAENSLRMRDEFVSVAAHELKTPLTALHGSVQLLQRLLDKDGMVSAEQLGRWLPIIEGQSRRLGILVAQLLDLPRIETGALQLDRRKVDLGQLIDGLVVMKQPDSTRHVIRFRRSGPMDVVADRVRVEQIITNLLDNAVKYSPHGGPVTVEARRLEDAMDVTVSDRGPGVEPEHRERIFERFYRAHSQAGLPGLGLGLYVSRYLAEAHGGSLTAEFPEDGGSRFTLSIPLRTVEKSTR